MTFTDDKLPPFDNDAEEALVASLMVDDEAADRIVGLVHDRDFFRDQNRWSFIACQELWRRGETVNQVTVAHELARREKLDDAGGIPYLARIVGDLATPVGVEHYANLVHKDAVYRTMIHVAAKMVQVAYQAPADLAGTLASFEKMLQDVIQDHDAADGPRMIAELVNRFWEQPGPESILSAMARAGFMDLDELLGGFRRGALTTIAAKTGAGKSALLLNIARNMAVAQNLRTQIVTLEMSADEWTIRLLARETGINSRRLRLGEMNEAEERAAMTATGEISAFPISIDDRAYMTVEQIRAAARRTAAAGGLDCLMVDYLQLAAGGRNRENRVQEVTDISRGLKRIARDMNIPVIAAAQLSRAIDYRKGNDAKPRLSDLRESGSIEQDSDVVMFLHRQPLSKADWATRYPNSAFPEGVVQVLIAKNRGGPVGGCSLRMRPETATFEDLSPPSEEEETPQAAMSWAR